MRVQGSSGRHKRAGFGGHAQPFSARSSGIQTVVSATLVSAAATDAPGWPPQPPPPSYAASILQRLHLWPRRGCKCDHLRECCSHECPRLSTPAPTTLLRCQHLSAPAPLASTRLQMRPSALVLQPRPPQAAATPALTTLRRCLHLSAPAVLASGPSRAR